jgi:flagella basal body P-ring formation protein FlgA
MVGTLRKVILAVLCVVFGLSPSFALSSVPLAGTTVTYGEGAEVLMEAVKASGAGTFPWNRIEMDPPRFEFSGVIVAPKKLRPGTPSVTLRVRESSGGVTARVVRLVWYAPMVHVVRDLRRGESLSASDVALRVAPYRRSMGEVFASSMEVVGKRVRRSLRAGDVISGRDVEVVPLVDRGDPVTIFSRSGAVTATLKGVALEAGGPGDRIMVRATRYREDVLAVIQGPGRVLVQEEE